MACTLPVGEEPEDTVVEAALDDPDYRFCHEPRATEYTVREWCQLLEDAPPDKCPGMRETCAGREIEDVHVPTQAQGCTGRSPASSSSGDGIAGEAEPPAEPPPVREPMRCTNAFDGAGLSQLLSWIGAFMVAVLVLLLLRAFITTFGAPRLPARELPPSAPPPDEDDALPDVPNLPSADLLTAAREALNAGRPGEAVLLARGAALRKLGEASRLRLHRSKTDREYVRALRNAPDTQRELREVVGAVEHHKWGGDPLEESRARSAISAVERLLGALGAGLLLVALMGSSAALAQVSRYGPNGDAAIRTVLENHGYDVTMRLRSLSNLTDEVDALVIDLDYVQPRDAHWTTVHDWVRAGGVLLVGGNPTYREDFEAPVFPELGRHASHECAGQVVGEEALGELPTPTWPGGPRKLFDGGQPWVSVEDCAAAVTVAWVGDGVVIGVADARLLWNGSFVLPDNERFIGELLYHGQAMHGWPLPTPARVQLATTSSVLAADDVNSANNPLASMNNARLAQFMGQLLVAWALLGLWRGWPFAPRRDPPSEGRLEFSEHVHALGTRWYRQGASRYALVQTATLWLARLGSSGLQLAARRAGKTPAQAAAWVAGLQALVDDPRGPDDPSDLERMEELWKVTHPPT